MSYEQVSADRSRVAVLLVNGYGESNAAQDQVGATPFDTMQRLLPRKMSHPATYVDRATRSHISDAFLPRVSARFEVAEDGEDASVFVGGAVQS